ncbi:SCO family protein [Sedimentitalea sp. XS_ASV28]|uniref:SCO family protein n=1 Tax=Sedimentitalea sp. XS_ASV28 TaxID=3241296 RepID=UPI0035171A5F
MSNDLNELRSSRTRVFRAALWGAVLVALAGYAILVSVEWYSGKGTGEASYSGEADVRSEFSLINHTGRDVTEADFSDRWQLVFFGFTHCPDICPTTLAYMASALDILGERADQVAPLFITVDPARDTVHVMAEYVSAFHPRLIGLTGSEAQVAEAAASFRTWYERAEDKSAPDGYLMAHAGYIYLMGPDGRFEAVFQERGQPPEELAEEIAMRIEKGN